MRLKYIFVFIIIIIGIIIGIIIIDFSREKVKNTYKENGVINDVNKPIFKINNAFNLKPVAQDKNVLVISANDSTIELFWPWNFDSIGLYFENAYLVYLDSKLHDTKFIFKKDNKVISITYSRYEPPIQDYSFFSDEVISYAYECELVINKYQNQYFISFQLDNLYYDVKTTNINEKDLLKILQEIIL